MYNITEILLKVALKTITLSVELRKESLNSNGHQFHQYQQNKQLPLILTELTERQKIPQ
jgi:hypothetical protein